MVRSFLARPPFLSCNIGREQIDDYAYCKVLWYCVLDLVFVYVPFGGYIYMAKN